MVIRWGGDEFLIVGRCPSADAAQNLAERIRSAADDCSFVIGRGAAIEVRISVGWACYPFFRSHPESIGWEPVVGIADRALYVAKQSGSNAWVGILGTRASAESQIENLVVRINERPEELLRQGLIDVRSSIDETASVVLRRA